MTKAISETEIMRALRSQANEMKLKATEPSFLKKLAAWLKKVELYFFEAKLIDEQLELQKRSIRVSFHF